MATVSYVTELMFIVFHIELMLMVGLEYGFSSPLVSYCGIV